MLTVTFFTSENCHLCDQAKADLGALQQEHPHRLVVIGIDGNEDLEAAYGNDVPVVEVGPYQLKAPFDRQKLSMTLGAAGDRVEKLEALGDEGYQKRVERGRNISATDRFGRWFANHYMLVFNLLVLLYVGLPFVAPVLQRAGATTPATGLYRFYSGLCHQLSYRSWFLFGEQPLYPRAEAGLSAYATFEQATGLDEDLLAPARRFVGDDRVGYKVALCQRDVAIYGAILLFGLLFSLSGRKWPALPMWLWFLVGIVPIALDGGTQLVGSLFSALPGEPWASLTRVFPPRESTPLLRTLTGFTFGFATAWFGYPLVEEAMADTRRLLTKKYAQIRGE